MPHVITNYKVRSYDIQPGALASHILVLSNEDVAATLSITNPYTVSMGGYGVPAAIWVVGMSSPIDAYATVPITVMPTQSFSGSIGWFYVYQSDGDYDGTFAFKFAVLIASR